MARGNKCCCNILTRLRGTEQKRNSAGRAEIRSAAPDPTPPMAQEAVDGVGSQERGRVGEGERTAPSVPPFPASVNGDVATHNEGGPSNKAPKPLGPKDLQKKVDDSKERIVKDPDRQQLCQNVEQLDRLLGDIDHWLKSQEVGPAAGSTWKVKSIEESAQFVGDVFVKFGGGFPKTVDGKYFDSEGGKTFRLASQFLGHLGQIHWAGLALSGIAFALHNWRQIALNKEQFISTVRKMYELGIAVVLAVDTDPHGQNHNKYFRYTVEKAVQCIFDCIQESITDIQGNIVSKFIFAQITSELLKKQEAKVDSALHSLGVAMMLNVQAFLKCRANLVGAASAIRTEAVGVVTDDETQRTKMIRDARREARARTRQTYKNYAGVEKISDCLYDFHSCEKGELENVVLLFFHGIALGQLDKNMSTSHVPFETWTFEDAGPEVPRECWPSKLFKEDASLREKKIVVKALTVAYDASKYKTHDAGRFDLHLVATNFNQTIIRELVKDKRPIIVVAHSFGGFVIQKLISLTFEAAREGNKKQQEFLQNLEGIFFYSTPFKALEKETYNHFFPNPIPENTAGEACAYSAFVTLLEQLNEKLARNQSEFGGDIRAIAEKYRGGKRIKVAAMFEPNETIVEGPQPQENWRGKIVLEASGGAVPGGESIPGTLGDHFTICRPEAGEDAFTDNRYRLLRQFIEDILEEG